VINQDELNEALSLAKKMKNAFKAFEDIEKLIQAQASVQGTASDLEAKTAALRAELAELPVRLTEAKALHDDGINRLNAAFSSTKSKHDAELDRMDDDRKKAKAALDADLVSFSSERDIEKKKVADDIIAMKKELTEAKKIHAGQLASLHT
jgi:hypothetical protein